MSLAIVAVIVIFAIVAAVLEQERLRPWILLAAAIATGVIYAALCHAG